MELHAFDSQFLVSHTHDFAVFGPRGHFKTIGQRLALDGERVVTRHDEMLGQVGEHTFAVGFDLAYLAVHDGLRANDAATECLADRLMAEAHAENRIFARELAQHVQRDARVLWIARSRRQADPLWTELRDFVERDFVVAISPYVFAEFAEVLDQVIGERVVVVDHQQHGLSPVKSRYRGRLAPARRRVKLRAPCSRSLAIRIRAPNQRPHPLPPAHTDCRCESRRCGW